MATYIILQKLTEQGIQNIKGSPARLDAAKQLAKSMGGEIKATYLVMGEYDLVIILEAPNDEGVATGMLAVGMQGNTRSVTMRAFTEDEYRKIIAAIP
jgi:uncharacterized protein with GYD domain